MSHVHHHQEIALFSKVFERTGEGREIVCPLLLKLVLLAYSNALAHKVKGYFYCRLLCSYNTHRRVLLRLGFHV